MIFATDVLSPAKRSVFLCTAAATLFVILLGLAAAILFHRVQTTNFFLLLAAIGSAFSLAVSAVALIRQRTQFEDLRRCREELSRQSDELTRQKERTVEHEALKTAKDAAESANRAKSQFLAAMSHELRTPLNAIIGFSDVMMTGLIGPIENERHRTYIQDIHDSGTHLLDIINDILDLSKAEAGKLDLHPTWIDVAAVVTDVQHLMVQGASAAGLSFAVVLPDDELRIWADQRKLKQMLFNLLSNAFKFTQPGGSVTLTVTEDSAGVTFAVQDSGIGIDAADLDRVLQPFVQVGDPSCGRKQAGTGLGLPLVRFMAELHGGTFQLESEKHKGTSAFITLPHVFPASSTTANSATA